MSGNTEAGGAGWFDDEVVPAGLLDKCLARWLRHLLDQMSAAPGQPVSAPCGDWAATKAAYRFFDNPRVTEHGALASHSTATAMHCVASEGPILILQDTTEFTDSRGAAFHPFLALIIAGNKQTLSGACHPGEGVGIGRAVGAASTIMISKAETAPRSRTWTG